jgi:hypothetical protein
MNGQCRCINDSGCSAVQICCTNNCVT